MEVNCSAQWDVAPMLRNLSRNTPARRLASRTTLALFFLFANALAPSLSSGNTQTPRGPCTVAVVSTTPLLAVGECQNWIIGEVYDAELRIDGPGGMQHWSVAAMMGETWDIRTWTGPEVTVEYGGKYTVALVLDGTAVTETSADVP